MRARTADPAGVDEMFIGQLLGGATQIPGSPFEGRDPAELRATLTGDSGPELVLDAMLRLGPYGLSLAAAEGEPERHRPRPARAEAEGAAVHAVRAGRARAARMVTDLDRLRARLAAPAPEVVLIGRRQLRSNNSWLHNVASLVGGSNQCTLHVHPADVTRLGLGEQAVVRSAAGEVVVAVEPTDTIMPGVVSLPHGWGHAGGRQRVAAQHAGVNANALTDESVVDVPSGNAVFNGVPVTVSPYGP